jgi:hypothetical protein
VLNKYKGMEKIKTTVKIGEFIEAYHPNRGAVKMRVHDVIGNIVCCELDGVEESVRIALFNGSWRWEVCTD